MTLGDLAARLGCRLDGDAAIDVSRVAGLDEAGPGDVAFLANPRYTSKLAGTRASAVIVGQTATGVPCAALRAADPYLAFADAVELLMAPPRPTPGISPLADIHPSAQVGPEVVIGPFVVVGPDARIGARTVIHSRVSIGAGASVGTDGLIHSGVSVREGVRIGDRVVLQDGAVIGSDGFGFAHRSDGSHRKIPQVGGVVIEDDVEIGALTAIDRPAVGEARIGQGAKIDNLVQVAHGVKVGRHALVAGQSGIAGSSVLEDHVVLAGQSGVAGHVRVGRGAKVRAKSVVTKDVAPGDDVAGIPAEAVGAWREAAVLARRLPEIRRVLTDLTARLDRLDDSRK